MMVSTEATDGVLFALPEKMKLLPTWVLRIPTIDDSSVCAFCCAMVCPVLLRACGVLAASLCTCPLMLDSDCSAVLAASMVVLTLVMVSVNAEIWDNWDRAAIANPSPVPMPE